MVPSTGQIKCTVQIIKIVKIFLFSSLKKDNRIKIRKYEKFTYWNKCGIDGSSGL